MSELRSEYRVNRDWNGVSGGRPRPERAEQGDVMRWSQQATRQWPELRWLFAVPNAAKRSKRTAGSLLGQGLKAGVPDLLLPVARGGFFGMAIEMKVTGRKPTELQDEWLTGLRDQGWQAHVCFSALQAIDLLRAYMALPRTKAAA